VLFVLILSLLSSCGLYNQSDKTKDPSMDTTSNQTISSSPTPAVNTTDATNSDLFSNIVDYTIENPKTYYNDEFKLSVDYPSAWKVYAEKIIEGNEQSEGNPQNGLFIYADSLKEESIYVYHQLGHIAIPPNGLTLQTFTTEEGVNGQILYDKSENDITLYLVLGAGFNGAIIQMSNTTFEKNLGQICGILKSIKISESE